RTWISIAAADATICCLWSRSPASFADTLAFRNDSPNPKEATEWQSNGHFGQLAFTLFSGDSAKLFAALPSPAPPTTRPASNGTLNGVFRDGNGVSAPSMIQKIEPQFTDAARKARVRGLVRMDCIVHSDGTLSVIRIIDG